MNSSTSSESLNETHEPETSPFLRWLCRRNPFYICSAGLLLYAIYRLSVDPRMFATELGQLLFNFGSFQFYELLLVGTAIFLARRRIGYDSSLLVSLESLFVLVPFILISQALLIEWHIAMMFCLGATVLAVVRFAAVKKFFGKLNMPPRLLSLGGVLLLVNLGLPLLVRMLHDDTNMFVWEMRGATFYGIAWLICMPVLIALVNCLPRAVEQGELLVQKGYFPISILAVWVAVTGIHLYSVGYVYGLKWTASFLVPILWVAALSVRNRIHDFDILEEERNADLHELLLLPVALVPILAAFTGHWMLFLVITALNVGIFCFLTVRDRSRMAFHLMLLSGAMIFAGLPGSLFELLHLNVSRGVAITVAVAAYIVLRAILSSCPKLGLLGAIVTGICACVLFHKSSYLFDVGAQVALVFLLIHSLRWEDKNHQGATIARVLAAMLWITHSMVWLARDGTTALSATLSFAGVVLVVYFLVKAIFNIRAHRIILYAALFILGGKPLLLMQAFVKDAPVGVIAMVASLVLFVFGTVAALVGNRAVNKNERTVRATTQISTTL